MLGSCACEVPGIFPPLIMIALKGQLPVACARWFAPPGHPAALIHSGDWRWITSAGLLTQPAPHPRGYLACLHSTYPAPGPLRALPGGMTIPVIIPVILPVHHQLSKLAHQPAYALWHWQACMNMRALGCPFRLPFEADLPCPFQGEVVLFGRRSNHWPNRAPRCPFCPPNPKMRELGLGGLARSLAWLAWENYTQVCPVNLHCRWGPVRMWG